MATFLFGRVPGLKPCGPTALSNAVLAFEFARSPADIASLFGTEPCRSTLVAAQRTGLLLDGLWFIPAYTAFLGLAALAIGAGWRRWLIGALLVAGLSDQVEGVILWAILDRLPGTPGLLDALWVAVHLKFLLLAVGTTAIGLGLWHRDWRILPALVVGAAGTFAFAQLLLGNVASMMSGFGVGWFSLLAVALVCAIWPSASAGSANRRRGPAPPAA